MILRVFLTIYALVLVFTLSSGQVLQFGTCAEVETVKFFDIQRFLGKWYEIERFPTWYEDFGTCAFKTIEACGRRIEITHGFVRFGIQYVLHINSSYIPGDEAVFEIMANNIDPVGIPLSVTSTDYDNYAVIYGCQNSPLLGLKYISAWILSRNTTLDPEILHRAQLELNSLPYASIAHLQTVPQGEENCDHFWTAHVQAENRTRFWRFLH